MSERQQRGGKGRKGGIQQAAAAAPPKKKVKEPTFEIQSCSFHDKIVYCYYTSARGEKMESVPEILIDCAAEVCWKLFLIFEFPK